jgi:hypothetical protein
VDLPSQGLENRRVLKIAYLLENYMKMMIGNVVISKVDSPMYVVLSEAEKHLPHGNIVGTTKCITFDLRFCTNHGCYNQV